MNNPELQAAAREILNSMYERFEMDGVYDEVTATAAIVALAEQREREFAQSIVSIGMATATLEESSIRMMAALNAVLQPKEQPDAR